MNASTALPPASAPTNATSPIPAAQTSEEAPAVKAPAVKAPVKMAQAAKAPAKKAASKPSPKVAAPATPKPVAKPATTASAGKPVKAPVNAPAKAASKPVAKPAAKKAVTKPATRPANAPVTVEKAKAPKEKAVKMVRDSFTFPKAEYDVLALLKSRSNKLGVPAKKTELLRASIKLLAAVGDKPFLAALAAVPNLKTGRPSK